MTASLATLTPIAWRVLQVSEARATAATRENLALGLTARAAEHVAGGGRNGAAWLDDNPFRQLRWTQNNDCGELGEGQLPRRGCWYFRPLSGWVIYRSRYRGWQEQGGGVEAWALKRVPAATPDGVRQRDGVVSLELEPVPAGELAHWMTAIEERATR